jgi:hypothetical protein
MFKSNCSKRVNFQLFVILIITILATKTSLLFGQCDEYNYYWIAGSGDWSVPENWEHQEWNSDPDVMACVPVSGVPSTANTVWITGGTSTISTNANAKIINASGSHLVLASGALEITEALGLSSSLFEQSGGEFLATWENVGLQGVGSLIQIGGTNSIQSALTIGWNVFSNGTYELDGDGELSACYENIGFQGIGTFTQSGGINTSTCGFTLGHEESGNGTYNLSEDARLNAAWEIIGSSGIGTFTQTGGINSIEQTLMIGLKPGSNGTYNLLGGTLNVGNTVVGDVDGEGGGIGAFLMDGGIINGTSDDSGLYVEGAWGSLTGPGTFNINVVYESDKIYGTYWDQGVAIIFEPYCLSSGGLYSVHWTTPTNFAGGMAPNLLPSSVFNISFDGSHCSQFTIAIPYNENEVSYYDADESELLVLQETGSDTYKQISGVEIDTYNNIIYADCNSFGKYAVAVPQEYYGGGNPCPPWYLGNLDHDCDVDYNDLAILAENWLKNEPSADIAPIGGDGVVNMQDFAVLASHWLEGI